MPPDLHSANRRKLLKGAAAAAGVLAVPTVARAQSASTIINPNGQAYLKHPADTGPIGWMLTHPNYPGVRYCNVPRPSWIPADHSRLTFAVDVCVVDQYLAVPVTNAHMVVASRMNMQDILNAGGVSAWHGVAVGQVWGIARVVAELRLQSGGSEEWNSGVDHSVVAHRWYRYVVDTVKWMGYRMFTIRVYDVVDELNNILGPALYSSPALYYPDSGYADTNDVVFANVSASTSSLLVGRIAAHWTQANEWVATP